MKIKPGLEASYAEYVAKNDDPYGKAVVNYAACWANLMEQHAERGEAIKDCAKTASHESDTDGITGFMYGCAVQALATSGSTAKPCASGIISIPR